jgi:hypothetical protein
MDLPHARCRFLQRGQQIAHRVGFSQSVAREADAKRVFNSQDKFGASQAVDPQIAIEPAHGRDGNSRAAPGMQLPDKLADQSEQLTLLLGIVSRFTMSLSGV